MKKRYLETLIEAAIFLSGLIVIIFVILIFVFLLRESIVFFANQNLLGVLSGQD